MNLRIFDSAAELTRAAARTIEQRSAGGAVVGLSGGSTPGPLYGILGASNKLRERAMTWLTVDERCVPIADPRSNAAMIQRTLFAQGLPPQHRFLPFRTELETPAATAQQFEQEWQSLGLTVLDVVILGVGDDGHTASLFPGTTALEVSDRIATEVFVPKLDMWRVTLTLTVIRAAKLRMVIATGESKREVIAAVRAGADLPIVHATAGENETWWFVDRAAMES